MVTANVDVARYCPFYREGDPIYTKYMLSGLLLVLSLHLLFNGSEALCEVVLALLHNQVDILGELVGEVKRLQLAKSIPVTVKGVLSLFDLDPVVSRFVVCPQCYDITPLQGEDKLVRSCVYKSTPASPTCGANLVRTTVVNGKQVHRPIKEYVHQSFRDWLARFICRPDIENLL